MIDAGLLHVLSRAGMPVWAAATVGFWTSVVANFLLNRPRFSSPAGAGVHRHALRYGALLLANFVVTLIILEVGSRLGLPVLVSKTLAVVLTTGWNFVLYRAWVFR